MNERQILYVILSLKPSYYEEYGDMIHFGDIFEKCEKHGFTNVYTLERLIEKFEREGYLTILYDGRHRIIGIRLNI